MDEVGIDYERRDALNSARNAQMPNAEKSHPADLHIPKNGQADNPAQNSNEEGSHSERLAAARKDGIVDAAKTAKDLAAVATPAGALSLMKQINLMSDMPYVAAMGAALLKDLLDFVAGPTVILSVLFSILCSIFIFMMMLLVGSTGKKKGASKFLSKIGILGAGGIADSIPGIDFLPIETATVAAIYFMELVERIPKQGKADNYSQDSDDNELAA